MNNLTSRYWLLQKARYLISNRIVLSFLSLMTTYAVFSALALNAWIYVWLKGKYYYSYQLLYLLIIFLSFHFYLAGC